MFCIGDHYSDFGNRMARLGIEPKAGYPRGFPYQQNVTDQLRFLFGQRSILPFPNPRQSMFYTTCARAPRIRLERRRRRRRITRAVGTRCVSESVLNISSF